MTRRSRKDSLWLLHFTVKVCATFLSQDVVCHIKNNSSLKHKFSIEIYDIVSYIYVIKVTALIHDELINDIKHFASGKNLTESLVTALEEWLSLKKIHALNDEIMKKPLEFSKGLSAQIIRSTIRLLKIYWKIKKVLAIECIFGELLQGGKSKCEIEIISLCRENLPKAIIDNGWIEAGKYASINKLTSIGVGLIDNFIIVTARKVNAPI